jgi:hypothetical protein
MLPIAILMAPASFSIRMMKLLVVWSFISAHPPSTFITYLYTRNNIDGCKGGIDIWHVAHHMVERRLIIDKCLFFGGHAIVTAIERLFVRGWCLFLFTIFIVLFINVLFPSNRCCWRLDG